MKKLAASVLIAAALGTTSAHATGYADHKFRAVIRCHAAAEDSLAHVRMVRFEGPDGVSVYRCQRHGY